MAWLGEFQFYRGYCLLVSRRHATELSGLSVEERTAYLEEMCLLAKAIETAFRPHKMNYELLGNKVPHLHWHLFPRYLQDPNHLKPVWLDLELAGRDPGARERFKGPEKDRPTIAEALRLTLASMTSPHS